MRRGLIEALVGSFPLISSLLCIWVYNSMNTDLNVEDTLALLALFNLGVTPLRGFATTLLNIYSLFSSIERINLLLHAAEQKVVPDDWRLENGTIEIENASFSWNTKESIEYFSDVRNGDPLRKAIEQKTVGDKTYSQPEENSHGFNN